jgi:hypothetical protein
MIFARSDASLIGPYRPQVQGIYQDSLTGLLPKRQRLDLCGLSKAQLGSEPKGWDEEPYNRLDRASHLDTSTTSATFYPIRVAMPHDGQCKCGEIKIHLASTHTAQDICACTS